MNKQEKYLRWVINDIKKNTTLDRAQSTKINLGGVWSAYPQHFLRPPDRDASIFASLGTTLAFHYGITEGELWMIVDELYPYIVDRYLLDFPMP